jgi:CBS domain-containing protein/ribosome-associated translation inhibitor RaiA
LKVFEQPVEEIMTPAEKVITADPDEPISKIFAKMERYGVKEIPLVRDGEVVGIVSYYDVVDAHVVSDPSSVKSETLKIKPETITPDTLIVEAITEMLDSGLRALPVVEDGEFAGLVTEYDIIDVARESERLEEIDAREIMNSPPITIHEDETIAKARALMRDHGISRLPVVNDENKLRGIVTTTDIIREVIKPITRLGKTDRKGEKVPAFGHPVKSIMSSPCIRSEPDETVVDLCEKIVEHRIRGMPIVNQLEEPIGVVTRRDILRKIPELMRQRGVFVSLKGVEDVDDFTLVILRKSIAAAIQKLASMRPTIEAAEVHVKRYHEEGNRHKYSVRIHVKDARNVISVKAHDWDLITALKKAIRHLLRETLGEEEKEETVQRREALKAKLQRGE